MNNERSAEHAFGAMISIPVNGEPRNFDLIRVLDIVDFSKAVHDEVRRNVLECIDRITDDVNERVKIIVQLSAGNAQGVIAQMGSFSGAAYFVDRCFARANPDCKLEPSRVLCPGELMGVFMTLAAASGVFETGPTETGEAMTEKSTGAPLEPTSPTTTQG